MMFCRLRRGFTKQIHQNWPKSFRRFQVHEQPTYFLNSPRWGFLSKSLHQPVQEAFRNIVGRLLEAWQRECLEDWTFLPCGDVFRAYRQHTPNSIGTLNTWNRSSKVVERAWTCKYHIYAVDNTEYYWSSHGGAHAFNVVRFPEVSLFFSWLELLHHKCQ